MATLYEPAVQQPAYEADGALENNQPAMEVSQENPVPGHGSEGPRRFSAESFRALSAKLSSSTAIAPVTVPAQPPQAFVQQTPVEASVNFQQPVEAYAEPEIAFDQTAQQAEYQTPFGELPQSEYVVPEVAAPQAEYQTPFAEAPQSEYLAPEVEAPQVEYQTPFSELPQSEYLVPEVEAPQAENQTPFAEVAQSEHVVPEVEAPQAEYLTPFAETPQSEYLVPEVEAPQAEYQAPVPEAPQSEYLSPQIEAPQAEHVQPLPEIETETETGTDAANTATSTGSEPGTLEWFLNADLPGVSAPPTVDISELPAEEPSPATPAADISTPPVGEHVVPEPAATGELRQVYQGPSSFDEALLQQDRDGEAPADAFESQQAPELAPFVQPVTIPDSTAATEPAAQSQIAPELVPEVVEQSVSVAPDAQPTETGEASYEQPDMPAAVPPADQALEFVDEAVQPAMSDSPEVDDQVAAPEQSAEPFGDRLPPGIEHQIAEMQSEDQPEAVVAQETVIDQAEISEAPDEPASEFVAEDKSLFNSALDEFHETGLSVEQLLAEVTGVPLPAQSKDAGQAEETAETEHAAEAEDTAEAKDTAEAVEVAEAEDTAEAVEVAEAEETVEAEDAAEADKAVEAADAVDEKPEAKVEDAIAAGSGVAAEEQSPDAPSWPKGTAAESDEFAADKIDPQAGETARMLLDIMSKPSGAAQPQERALAADTLLRLVPKIPVANLITLAERICMMETPPALLVNKMLKHPRAEVVGPLLEGCVGISDQVLMTVISSGDIDKQKMIARRRLLTPTMCDELLDHGDASVYLTIVRNPGASISHDAFMQLSDFAKDQAALQAPLVTRGDTPAPIAFELFWFLPSELRRYVLSRFLTDSETLDKILKITLAVDGAGNADGEQTENMFADPEKMEELVTLIEKGEIEDATDLLAQLAGINKINAKRIICDSEGEPITVAMKAIGYPRNDYAAVVEKWRARNSIFSDSQRSTTELQNLFDSLSFNKARMLMTYWDWAADSSGPYALKAA